MPQSPFLPRPLPVARLAIIAVVVGVAAVAFAYTAGWLSPHRLTPAKLVASLAPPGGPALGHRRNHAKGICFTGTFAANGNGSEFSKAQVFVPGQYPVVGRFNLATAIFPVSTVQGFYDLQMASGSKNPAAMKEFIAAHPGFITFLGWAKSAPWTGS